MKQQFKDQTVSFKINEDQTEVEFTVHDAYFSGVTLSAASHLGSQFLYSVLGTGPSPRQAGGQLNEDRSVTVKFRV